MTSRSNAVPERNRNAGSVSRGPTPFDKLKQAARTTGDGALFAKFLGDAAEQISPDDPLSVAKKWLGQLEGDAWAKRKRHILFSNEEPAGTMASSGPNWAALIERAAKDLIETGTENASVEDICRRAIRGSTFLPELATLPVETAGTQSLLKRWADKVCGLLAEKSDIERLWSALDQSPFDIEACATSKRLFDPVWHAGYDGDEYSRGPLGRAARLAADPARLFSHAEDATTHRFAPCPSRQCYEWAEPSLFLGFMGERHQTEVFWLPDNFDDEAYPDVPKDDSWAYWESVGAWLDQKGLQSAFDDGTHREIQFSNKLKFGWAPFTIELRHSVYLSVERRSDATPGIKIDIQESYPPHIFPVLRENDLLKSAARQAHKGPEAYPADVDGMFFIDWSETLPEFDPSSHEQLKTRFGLIDWLGLPDSLENTKGWIDDFAHQELQHLSFGMKNNVRFCPKAAVDEGAFPPCRPNSIVASIFSNLGTDEHERLGTKLLEQAQIISSNGLEFHKARISGLQSQIDDIR